MICLRPRRRWSQAHWGARRPQAGSVSVSSVNRQFQLDLEDRAPARGPSIGVAPMVDIILLLICFYLFVSRFVETREDPTVTPPVITHRVEEDRHAADIVINVRADQTMIVNGQQFTLEQLSQMLRSEQWQQSNIVIRVDYRQRFGLVDEVMESCREAGFSKVVLRALEAG